MSVGGEAKGGGVSCLNQDFRDSRIFGIVIAVSNQRSEDGVQTPCQIVAQGKVEKGERMEGGRESGRVNEGTGTTNSQSILLGHFYQIGLQFFKFFYR